jgi:hypothetical protein
VLKKYIVVVCAVPRPANNAKNGNDETGMSKGRARHGRRHVSDVQGKI